MNNLAINILKQKLSRVQALREHVLLIGAFGSWEEKLLTIQARELLSAIDTLNEKELKSMPTEKYTSKQVYPSGEGGIQYPTHDCVYGDMPYIPVDYCNETGQRWR